MLPLHNSAAPRYQQRNGWFAGASRRKKMFLVGGVVLLTFSLVLILLVNTEMDFVGTSWWHAVWKSEAHYFFFPHLR